MNLEVNNEGISAANLIILNEFLPLTFEMVFVNNSCCKEILWILKKKTKNHNTKLLPIYMGWFSNRPYLPPVAPNRLYESTQSLHYLQCFGCGFSAQDRTETTLLLLLTQPPAWVPWQEDTTDKPICGFPASQPEEQYVHALHV